MGKVNLTIQCVIVANLSGCHKLEFLYHSTGKGIF
jgi:hypothetical protein